MGILADALEEYRTLPRWAQIAVPIGVAGLVLFVVIHARQGSATPLGLYPDGAGGTATANGGASGDTSNPFAPAPPSTAPSDDSYFNPFAPGSGGYAPGSGGDTLSSTAPSAAAAFFNSATGQSFVAGELAPITGGNASATPSFFNSGTGQDFVTGEISAAMAPVTAAPSADATPLFLQHQAFAQSAFAPVYQAPAPVVSSPAPAPVPVYVRGNQTFS